MSGNIVIIPIEAAEELAHELGYGVKSGYINVHEGRSMRYQLTNGVGEPVTVQYLQYDFRLLMSGMKIGHIIGVIDGS